MTALDNGAAVRRRERRLLGGLRHEQINVAMGLAAHVARRSAEPEDRHQRSTPLGQADHGAQCVSQRLVEQLIDVLSLESVTAPSVEQTADVSSLMNPKMPWTSWKMSWMLQGRLRS